MHLNNWKPIFASVILGVLTGLLFLKPKERVTLNINGKEYLLEVAATKSERARGLMNKNRLAPNRGMLFIFPSEGKHGFWMYKTFIPLDIIWLDKNWNPVYVRRNVPPCESSNPLKCPSYLPTKKAKYVIEIPAGSVL